MADNVHASARVPQGFVRAAAVVGTVAVWALWGPGGATALSCVEHPDLDAAAREAIAGEHPLWAQGYIVAVVESVSEEGDLRLVTVRPTHIFSGDYPEIITLQARPDGPPVPGVFQVGRSYFLSLARVEPSSNELLIQPCAPNFEVSPEQVQGLVDGVDDVEIRTAPAPAADPVPSTWALIAGLALAGVVGLGVVIVARRR